MAIDEITDEKIRELREMPKAIKNPGAKRRKIETSYQQDFDVSSEDERYHFRIYLRQSLRNHEDYSCGIRWQMPSGETLTLARYNGSSHIHDDIQFQCHIHMATENAIRKGKKPERHADATDRYNSLDGALNCLLKDFNISGLDAEKDHQTELFDGA